MTTAESEAPIPRADLQALARQARLDLSAEDLAALEPLLRRTLAQVHALRELPLAAYEPGVVFTPARQEGQA